MNPIRAIHWQSDVEGLTCQAATHAHFGDCALCHLSTLRWLHHFFDSLFEHFRFKAFFGVHLLQAPVLIFKLLEPGHHGGIHSTELGPPLVKRRAAHAMLATKIRNRYARLGLFQNRQNLAIGKSRLLHKNLLMLCYEKILLMSTADLAGGLPIALATGLAMASELQGNSI